MKDKNNKRINKALDSIFKGVPVNTRRAMVAKWRAWSKHNKGIDGKETVGDARSFIASLKKKGIAQSSIHHYAIILKGIYEKLIDYTVLDENIFEKVAKQTKKGSVGLRRPTKLTPFEKVMEMLEACEKLKHTEVKQAILAILYGAGRRLGELEKIELNDLHKTDAGHLYITLRETKNGQDFNAVIPDDLAEYVYTLAECRRKEGETKLFKESYKTLYRYFKDVANACGLDVSPHSGRATAITYLLDKGMDYQQVKEFSGHASINTVSLYDKRRYQKDKSPALAIFYDDIKGDAKKIS